MIVSYDFKAIVQMSERLFQCYLLVHLQGPTENRQGEWAPWLNIIIIIIIIINAAQQLSTSRSYNHNWK